MFNSNHNKNIIVQADLSQESSYFGKTAGNQCTAIVVYAMVYSKIEPLQNWTRVSLNNILKDGNKYYIECRQRADINQKFLNVEETLGPLCINGYCFNIELYIQFRNSISPSSVYDILNGENLRHHLKEFYHSNCSYVTLTTNNFTFGVFKQYGVIYFFDSHGQHINGNTDANSRASLRSFNDIKSLVSYIKSLFDLSQKSYFQLTYVKITEIGNVLIQI